MDWRKSNETEKVLAQLWKVFLLAVPLAVLILLLVLRRTEQILPRQEQTIAEEPRETVVTFDMEINRSYGSEDGVVVIPAPEITEKTEEQPEIILMEPEQVWKDGLLSTEDYTLPEEATLEDGSLGILSIPKLSLTAPVYEAEDGGEMESMTKGIAHFAITSAWDGNVGLCSHNVAPRGAVAYFRDLYLLDKGDEIHYKSSLGERSYQVTEIQEIAGDDWSSLMRSEDNRLTLITCITGKPQQRLMVQAVQF